ncbi:MAG: PD40 domain-containing protein [Chloroflexi bacterium]|nr:PD40 domain-containing protein [Chloroflexota bacterium]
MSNRRPASTRASRDPYGIGPVAGYAAPLIAVVALVIIAIVTLNLLNGQLPFRTLSGTGNDPGPAITPAPSHVVIVPPELKLPGSIVYAKTGNIWIQTAPGARQLTDSGTDSMPSFAPDGQWVYFIRIAESRGKFPIGGSQSRAWYDLSTPSLMRVKPDGTGAQRLLAGRFTSGNSTWFYWLRQPAASPDGKTIALISDGPNPLRSDVVLQTFDLATKKMTNLKLGASGNLGHQDPAWGFDGRFLLYVRNGRELTRGAPQIYRYDVTTKQSRQLTGPGYLAPAYSPNGSFIAATKSDAFGTDVAILDAAGKELLRVTNDGHSFSPVWSPAGDAVAFLHLAGTIVDLRMARLDNATGRWTVTETLDLTTVSGLDGASRPSWFVPASELPARPSAAPAVGPSSAVPSSSGSTAP